MRSPRLLAGALATLLQASAAFAETPRPAFDSLPVPVRFQQVFGARMAYYEVGKRDPTRPTLILIPHLGWDAQMFAANLPELAANHHVIAIDPIGFGRSDKPLLDYKMDTWSDTIAEFIREKHLGKVVIGGPAMGGAQGIQIALDEPDLVAGVVVVASNSGPGKHTGDAPRSGPYTHTLAGTRAYLLDHFFDDRLVTDQFVRQRFAFRLRTNDAYTIARHLADHRPPYSMSELARIKVPVLFIWCREDTITPLSWGEDFARALPKGRLTILNRCGHLPNIEAPAQFNAAVTSFMHQLSAAN